MDGRFREGEERSKDLRSHAWPGSESYNTHGSVKGVEEGMKGLTMEVLPFWILTNVHRREMVIDVARTCG